MLRYIEQASSKSAKALGMVPQRVPILNADEFGTVCTTQIRFMIKLAIIGSERYLAQIGRVNISRAIKDYGRPVGFRMKWYGRDD